MAGRGGTAFALAAVAAAALAAPAAARVKRSVVNGAPAPGPYAAAAAAAAAAPRAGSPGSCAGLPGVWTGFVGVRPLYDEYSLGFPSGGPPGAFTAVVLRPAPDGEGWTFGAGQLGAGNTTVTLTLDNGLTLTGNVSADCGTLFWDNGSSWARKSGIDVVHIVAMNHLDGEKRGGRRGGGRDMGRERERERARRSTTTGPVEDRRRRAPRETH
jgi:hypothetical protein